MVKFGLLSKYSTENLKKKEILGSWYLVKNLVPTAWRDLIWSQNSHTVLYKSSYVTQLR